jgi:hypothetical protein
MKERRVMVIAPGKALLTGGLMMVLLFGGLGGAFFLLKTGAPQAVQAQGEVKASALLPNKVWFFAEGYTGNGFQEYILLFSPPAPYGSQTGTGVDLELYGPSGYIGTIYSFLSQGQRESINLNDAALRVYGYKGDVSVVVKSDYPIIAERSMYFNFMPGTLNWEGGTAGLGYGEVINP